MKNTLFTLILVSFFLMGSGNSKKENSSATTPNPAVAEKEGTVINLTKPMFLEEVWDYEKSPQTWVFKGHKPVIIDFYADWCGPCRTAAPILKDIAKEYTGKVKVYKVDTMVETELKAVFGVQGIPAFLYIPMEGKPTMTSGIARTEAETKNMFRQYIKQILKIDAPVGEKEAAI